MGLPVIIQETASSYLAKNRTVPRRASTKRGPEPASNPDSVWGPAPRVDKRSAWAGPRSG
jgi:hypothetical protein